ncbi:MAG: cyanophycinase, partial [Planctomycetes bacterium]|nr:cyanophycinase [Planctomycetota bacterium]
MFAACPPMALLVVFLFVSGESPAQTEVAPRESTAGALVIVGGGGTPDVAKQRALALAGGDQARVLIFAQASTRTESGDAIAAMWRQAGARNTTVADLTNRPSVVEALESATLIWFGGGSQNRLMAALTEHDLVLAIRRRHQAGAVVGGTSAGAAVLSDPMVSGKVEDSGIVAAGTELKPGLGLIQGVLLDQHFLARRRIQRLTSAILDHPDLLGVGIDERCAIVVRSGSFEVLGQGSVIVIDARAATVS